jgi:hypothetical protein
MHELSSGRYPMNPRNLGQQWQFSDITTLSIQIIQEQTEHSLCNIIEFEISVEAKHKRGEGDKELCKRRMDIDKVARLDVARGELAKVDLVEDDRVWLGDAEDADGRGENQYDREQLPFSGRHVQAAKRVVGAPRARGHGAIRGGGAARVGFEVAFFGREAGGGLRGRVRAWARRVAGRWQQRRWWSAGADACLGGGGRSDVDRLTVLRVDRSRDRRSWGSIRENKRHVYGTAQVLASSSTTVVKKVKKGLTSARAGCAVLAQPHRRHSTTCPGASPARRFRSTLLLSER